MSWAQSLEPSRHAQVLTSLLDILRDRDEDDLTRVKVSRAIVALLSRKLGVKVPALPSQEATRAAFCAVGETLRSASDPDVLYAALRVYKALRRYPVPADLTPDLLEALLSIADRKEMSPAVELSRMLLRPPRGKELSTTPARRSSLPQILPSLAEIVFRAARERLRRESHESGGHEALVLELRYVKDSSYQEIADALGIPTSSVSSILNRAKRRLLQNIRDVLASVDWNPQEMRKLIAVLRERTAQEKGSGIPPELIRTMDK